MIWITVVQLAIPDYLHLIKIIPGEPDMKPEGLGFHVH